MIRICCRESWICGRRWRSFGETWLMMMMMMMMIAFNFDLTLPYLTLAFLSFKINPNRPVLNFHFTFHFHFHFFLQQSVVGRGWRREKKRECFAHYDPNTRIRTRTRTRTRILLRFFFFKKSCGGNLGSLVAVVVFLFPIVPDSTNNLKSQIWPTITTSPTHLDGRYQLLLPSAYYQLSNLKWMVKIEWNVLSSGATFYSISFSFPFFFF